MKSVVTFVLVLFTFSNVCATQQMVIVRHGESDHNAAKIYNTKKSNTSGGLL